MSKIWLIIKREYSTRVKKKSFVIMSLLTPVLLALVMIVPMWLATRDVASKELIVVDESGLIKGNLEETSTITYDYYDQPLSVAKEIAFTSDDKYGVLYIPKINLDDPKGIQLITEGSPSFEIVLDLEKQLKNIIEDYKLKNSGIDKEKLANLETWVKLETMTRDEGGEEQQAYTEVAYVVGYVGSLLIYILIFAYGIQTMRGVIEEKTSRIVEVIVSSVKPYQIMAGKIIGIGAVGLTQFAIWAFLTFSIYAVFATVFNVDQLQEMSQNASIGSAGMAAQNSEMIVSIANKIEGIPFGFLLGVFVFYFLGAYLFYGSIFAAIGSAVDSETDAQQFQMPITLPLIFSIVILAAVLREPHGGLATTLSIIPFTSPIVMMMRLPFMPAPTWDLYVSMIVLVISIVLAIMVAAKIYRIGILSYGTKPSYKTLFKWIFAKN